MTDQHPYGLFEVFGVELEYMVVHRETLDVVPIVDEVLREVAGEATSEVERGDMAWSNELTNHVLEFKTNGPAHQLDGLAEKFHQEVLAADEVLAAHDAMLMPTAMHPWMDPHAEMVLCPNENLEIYETYHRLFDCRGHGWANLQSTHINLPFRGDEEFGRLHAAVRLVLPLLPALAAASPIVESRATGVADNRLRFYERNQRSIPIITASVIPEPVYTEEEYNTRIFSRLREEIRLNNSEGILLPEFLNSRGAIARFERGSIEIRLLDIQECPAADIAILELVVAVLKDLVAEKSISYEDQRLFDEKQLKRIWDRAVEGGLRSTVEGIADDYLLALDIEPEEGVTFRSVWRRLARSCGFLKGKGSSPIEIILGDGGRNLSDRILMASGLDPLEYKAGAELDARRLREVYRQLCHCLKENRTFIP